MSKSGAEITIAAFDGDQATADAVAAHHLVVRFQQREDGESDFHGRIYSSQADLKNMGAYYVEPGGNFFIARDTGVGEIAGFIGLKKTGPDEGQIKRMAVLPAYRRRRIGTKLAETAVAWASKEGFKKLYLSTGKKEHAVGAYEAVGFVSVGYGGPHNDRLMELSF